MPERPPDESVGPREAEVEAGDSDRELARSVDVLIDRIGKLTQALEKSGKSEAELLAGDPERKSTLRSLKLWLEEELPKSIDPLIVKVGQDRPLSDGERDLLNTSKAKIEEYKQMLEDLCVAHSIPVPVEPAVPATLPEPPEAEPKPKPPAGEMSELERDEQANPAATPSASEEPETAPAGAGEDRGWSLGPEDYVPPKQPPMPGASEPPEPTSSPEPEPTAPPEPGSVAEPEPAEAPSPEPPEPPEAEPESPTEPPAEPPAEPAPTPAPPVPPEPEPETVPPLAPEPGTPGWAEPLDPARLEMMARQEIERIERDTKSKLSEEEKDVIRMLIEKRTGVGAGLGAIDQRTAELYETTYKSISKSSKLKRFLTGLGKVAGAGVIGAGLRTALRVIAPGFHFAGSAVGGVLGGTFGGLRGYYAEKGKQFGLGAISTEFQELAKTDRKRAVAFLHEVLTTQSFRGNHKELLNILALFRAEATGLALAEQQEQPDRVEAMMRFGQAQIAIDEMTAQTLLTEGLRAPDLLKIYREDPARRSMRIKAALKGALKGAVIGTGLGLISDLVGMYLSHARSEDAAQRAYDQFMERGAGGRLDYINRDIVPTSAEAQLPSDVAAPDWLSSHAFSSDPTDYGNALKHAIYSNQIRPEGTNISEEQYRGFLQLLNYVKPEQAQNLNVPLGEGVYHFDSEVLQGWVNNVFRDPQGISFQDIAHADSFIDRVTEGVAEKFGVAAASAVHPEGFAEMAAHAGAVGAGVGLAGLRGPRKTEETVGVTAPTAPAAPPPVETEEQRTARVRDEAMEDYHQILSGREAEIDRRLAPFYEEAREIVKVGEKYVFDLEQIKRILSVAEGKGEAERQGFLAGLIWEKKGRKKNDQTREADSYEAGELVKIMDKIRERRAQIEEEQDRQMDEIKTSLLPEDPADVIWVKTDLPEGDDFRLRMTKLSELTSSGKWKIIWTQGAIDETPELSGDFYLTAVHPDAGEKGKLFYSQETGDVYSPDQTSVGGDLLSKIKELKKIE